MRRILSFALDQRICANRLSAVNHGFLTTNWYKIITNNLGNPDEG